MHQLARQFRQLLTRRFFSIRFKLLLSLAVVILLFVGIAFYTSYGFVVKSSSIDLTKEGALLIRILRSQLADMVVVNDLAAINNLINRTKQNNPDILYIVVLDKNNSVIGHTFSSDAMPAYLAGKAPAWGISYLSDARLGLSIRQFSHPLLQGHDLGSVILGLDDSVVAARGRQIFLMMFVAFAVLLVPTGIAMYALSYLVTHPIKQVMRGIGRYQQGQPIPQIDIFFNDEMKLLAREFQQMAERIDALDRESKHNQLKIIETEKMASIGVLASGVAHEINNPIAGIEACVYRLQKNEDLNEKQREYIDLILDSAQHIQTVTRNLLQYARHPGQKEERIDLRGVVTFALRLLKYRLEKSKLRVESDIPDYPCLVAGVRASLIQVVINGLLNAIDASPADEAITVRISDGGTNYLLEIADRGSGVDPAIQGKVFDPFFTTKGSKGTGLGLYVSYTIIQAHGGNISLTSAEGRGTTLRVELPKLAPETIATAPTLGIREGI